PLGGRSVRPLLRFKTKAAAAGFNESLKMRRSELTAYARETLALVWPDKAYAFEQVVVRGVPIEEVARQKHVNERTVRRWLDGQDDLGAEDWFLITLELYREADCICTSGADTIRECMFFASLSELTYGAFHRSFFLL